MSGHPTPLSGAHPTPPSGAPSLHTYTVAAWEMASVATVSECGTCFMVSGSLTVSAPCSGLGSMNFHSSSSGPEGSQLREE